MMRSGCKNYFGKVDVVGTSSMRATESVLLAVNMNTLIVAGVVGVVAMLSGV